METAERDRGEQGAGVRPFLMLLVLAGASW